MTLWDIQAGICKLVYFVVNQFRVWDLVKDGIW